MIIYNRNSEDNINDFYNISPKYNYKKTYGNGINDNRKRLLNQVTSTKRKISAENIAFLKSLGFIVKV